MSDVDFGKSVTLKQAAQLIIAIPENRFLLQGEMGSGKSSIMAYFKTALPNHHLAYIDCASMDLGDAALPAADHELKVMDYYTNKRFMMHTGEPVVIMMDELGKAPRPVMNMLHPLLERHNPRIGNVPLPAGSHVFATTNLMSEGLGDQLPAHTRNRMSVVQVSKPNADEWLAWAIMNDIDPVVMAWVQQFPHALASFTDEGQADNAYINNPKKVQLACVTGRTLEMASYIIKRRDQIDAHSLIVALTGTIGASAAHDMQAFIAYQDQLPSWDSILASPTTAKVPDSPGACCVLVYGAISKVDKANFGKVMEYLKRFEPEWQATFGISVAKHPERYAIAASHPAFRDWALENADIL
jgi:hypothetical protein